jgi:hypothetical protein
MSTTACLNQIAGDDGPWGAGGGCFRPRGVGAPPAVATGCGGSPAVPGQRRGGELERETGGAPRTSSIAGRHGEDKVGPQRERTRSGHSGRGRGCAGRRVPALARPWRAGAGEAMAVACWRGCGHGVLALAKPWPWRAGAGEAVTCRRRRRRQRPASAEKAEVDGAVRES